MYRVICNVCNGPLQSRSRRGCNLQSHRGACARFANMCTLRLPGCNSLCVCILARDLKTATNHIASVLQSLRRFSNSYLGIQNLSIAIDLAHIRFRAARQTCMPERTSSRTPLSRNSLCNRIRVRRRLEETQPQLSAAVWHHEFRGWRCRPGGEDGGLPLACLMLHMLGRSAPMLSCANSMWCRKTQSAADGAGRRQLPEQDEQRSIRHSHAEGSRGLQAGGAARLQMCAGSLRCSSCGVVRSGAPIPCEPGCAFEK